MDKKERRLLISKTIVNSLFGCLLIYLCLTVWNNDIVKILNSVSESKIDALICVLYIFPILFIMNSMILLGNFVAQQGKKSNKTKKEKKK